MAIILIVRSTDEQVIANDYVNRCIPSEMSWNTTTYYLRKSKFWLKTYKLIHF